MHPILVFRPRATAVRAPFSRAAPRRTPGTNWRSSSYSAVAALATASTRGNGVSFQIPSTGRSGFRATRQPEWVRPWLKHHQWGAKGWATAALAGVVAGLVAAHT